MILLSDFKTLKKEASGEFIEKKSRFIGYAIPCATEDEAVSFIEKIRKKHYDATHNVYAYILRENNIARYSDDGEPSGTAGVPVLEVLQKEGITNACIVVTRYFGGTLLGAGGLVRAYTKGAKCGIDASGIIHRRLCGTYKVNIDYTMLGKVQSDLALMDCIVSDIEYTNDVTITLYIPQGNENILEHITDITNGRAIINKTSDEKYIDAE